jgi:hypothetical protein
MSVDRFGIPDNILGAHDEDFYGAIGRVALLSALVEYQALTIYQTMMNLSQTEGTQLHASQLAVRACDALQPGEEDQNKKTLIKYFTDVKTAFPERNNYIHNLWPAQPGDQFFGWRPNPDKKTRDNEPSVATQGNMDELKAFILMLVELVQRRDRVWVSASAQQRLKLNAEAAS